MPSSSRTCSFATNYNTEHISTKLVYMSMVKTILMVLALTILLLFTSQQAMGEEGMKSMHYI